MQLHTLLHIYSMYSICTRTLRIAIKSRGIYSIRFQLNGIQTRIHNIFSNSFFLLFWFRFGAKTGTESSRWIL